MKGRPHYYSTKKEEYAHIRFSLNADLSSLFNWNTKQVFVYVSASWPSNSSEPATLDNEAVIWDTIITNPSADHLQNIGPAAMKKLVKSSKGRVLILQGWFALCLSPSKLYASDNIDTDATLCPEVSSNSKTKRPNTKSHSQAASSHQQKEWYYKRTIMCSRGLGHLPGRPKYVFSDGKRLRGV